jgi:genome maintenance exonuclease 1
MKIEPISLKVDESHGIRLYITPSGDAYPSITTVLGGTQDEEKAKSLANWEQNMGIEAAREYTNKAASKGTNVHLLIERFLKEEDLQEDNFLAHDLGVFRALRLKLKNIQVWSLECPLYSDLLSVAGRTDCIGTYNGIPSIIDFKTSNRNKSDKDIFDYKLQCCFYAQACNELYGTDIHQGVVLMSTGKGMPLQFIFNLDEYKKPLEKRITDYYIKVAGMTFSEQEVC